MPVHDWTLVDAGLFHAFHYHWIAALCETLNGGSLLSAYYALPEQSIRGPVPDVLTLRLSPLEAEPPGAARAVAVADSPPRARVVQTSERAIYARKANRIAVRHRHGQVVSVIELVSPGNKNSSTEFRAFVEEVADLIQQGVHVLIVDLFPPTRRDPRGIHRAIWDEIEDGEFEPPADKPLTVASYSAGAMKTAYVEPCAVGDELPVMPLFLESESYVPIGLDAAYLAAWRAFPDRLKGLLDRNNRSPDLTASL